MTEPPTIAPATENSSSAFQVFQRLVLTQAHCANSGDGPACGVDIEPLSEQTDQRGRVVDRAAEFAVQVEGDGEYGNGAGERRPTIQLAIEQPRLRDEEADPERGAAMLLRRYRVEQPEIGAGVAIHEKPEIGALARFWRDRGDLLGGAPPGACGEGLGMCVAGRRLGPVRVGGRHKISLHAADSRTSPHGEGEFCHIGPKSVILQSISALDL